MFKKNSCNKCRKRVDKKYDFCPYCGNMIEDKEEDFGMLGKNDLINRNNEIRFPMGLNTIFNSLIKTMNKELSGLERIDSQKKQGVIKSGISINISSSGNNLPKISVNYLGDEKSKNKKNKEIKEVSSKFFSEEKTKKFLNLSREEPKTDVRRLSKKVIYEIEIPDVSSVEDISIIKLENSIEIRAIAKDKAYFKIIPINLPLTSYDFEKGKLILELNA